MKPAYEYTSEIRQPSAWIIILLFSGSIIMFGVIVHLVISDAPRRWDFGTLPDTPGESIYSSSMPDADETPQLQIEPLPGTGDTSVEQDQP